MDKTEPEGVPREASRTFGRSWQNTKAGIRSSLLILISVSCGTHGHLASNLPYLSLYFFKGCGTWLFPQRVVLPQSTHLSALSACYPGCQPMEASHGLAWPGPLARVLWRPHFLEPIRQAVALMGSIIR